VVVTNIPPRYVIVLAEALAVVAVTWRYRPTSFKRTPVVERMGLLTLIIMGEGIIGITKSVTAIFLNAKRASASDIGMVIAAVFLIVSQPPTLCCMR
jgi:low temperature requirement protein LtrA